LLENKEVDGVVIGTNFKNGF